MAKFEFKGIDKYIDSLNKIGGDNATRILKYAVYPGAGVIADAIREEVETHHKESGELAKSVGIAKIKNDSGFVNTRISFVGYDPDKVSKKFPKGVPNAVKARVLESGDSRGRKGTHFISKTVKRMTDKAIAEMSKALDEKIGQIMED